MKQLHNWKEMEFLFVSGTWFEGVEPMVERVWLCSARGGVFGYTVFCIINVGVVSTGLPDYYYRVVSMLFVCYYRILSMLACYLCVITIFLVDGSRLCGVVAH